MDDFSFYKSVLRKWYDKVRNGENAMYLSMPAQARLRNLCVEICRKGKKQDLITFRNFLGFDFSENATNQIQNETDRFKPIAKFLKDQSSLADMESVEMLAMLINFEYRPFQKFVANKEKFADSSDPETESGEAEGSKRQATDTNGSFSKLKWIAAAILMLLVGSVIVFVPILTQDNCMQWKFDHYERIDCDKADGSNHVEVFSKAQFDIHKIPVSAKTEFFRNQKPVLWYLKHHDCYEFFDHPGVHPDLPSKQLHPVSRYVAQGVVDGKLNVCP